MAMPAVENIQDKPKPAVKFPFDITAKHPAASIVTITPEIAAAALDIASPDRLLSLGTVEAYARAMAENRWRLNGEPVQFANNGTRLNGMHRYHACVKSGMPFKTVVVVGLDPEVQDTIDDPRRRSVNDQQRLKGLDMPSSASAAARWLLKLRLGSIGKAQRVTNQEVLAMLVKHPKLGDSARKILKSDTVALLPSIAVAVHYIGAELQGLPEKADSFLQVMISGVPAYEGDPAHLWREKLIKAKTHGNGLPASMQWDGTCHAWNSFVANTAMKRSFQIPDDVQLDGLDLRKI